MAWPPRCRSASPPASPPADRVAAATHDACASACGPPLFTLADTGPLPLPPAATTSSRSKAPTDSGEEWVTRSALSPSCVGEVMRDDPPAPTPRVLPPSLNVGVAAMGGPSRPRQPASRLPLPCPPPTVEPPPERATRSGGGATLQVIAVGGGGRGCAAARRGRCRRRPPGRLRRRAAARAAPVAAAGRVVAVGAGSPLCPVRSVLAGETMDSGCYAGARAPIKGATAGDGAAAWRPGGCSYRPGPAQSASLSKSISH